jgi:Ala-tRNA(Pro) deacylase
MLMPERLESHLDQNHIAYSLILHGPTPSAQVAASLMHLPGKAVAKSVALCTREHVLLAILPASYRINFEKLSAVVGDKVQMLEQEKCNEEFPDCETGAIPPFGELYDVPVFLDAALAEDAEIVFGAGTLSESVRMGSADFVRIVKPKICSFAEESSRVSTLREAQAYLRRLTGK